MVLVESGAPHFTVGHGGWPLAIGQTPKGANFDRFRPIFWGQTTQSWAKPVARGQKPGLGVRWAHSEGWEPLKMLGHPWRKCRQNCDSRRRARDMTFFLVLNSVRPEWVLNMPQKTAEIL